MELSTLQFTYALQFLLYFVPFCLFSVPFGMFSQHPHLSYFQCVLISICVSALNDQKQTKLNLTKYNCVCSMCFTHLRIKYNYNHKIQQQLHAVQRKPKTEPNLSFDVVMCRAPIHPYPLYPPEPSPFPPTPTRLILIQFSVCLAATPPDDMPTPRPPPTESYVDSRFSEFRRKHKDDRKFFPSSKA